MSIRITALLTAKMSYVPEAPVQSGNAGLDNIRHLVAGLGVEGKQTKNKPSRKDTGVNSAIDIIGGVIFSDLKGPMTPRGRLGDRNMVNFIDHRTNYFKIVLAKTKDVAAQKFKHFMVFFERQFHCRIHVLRTDGGGEYKTLDLFCKDTGIARHASEPRNPARNETAERMLAPS
ncbi:hypothetical protein PF004_g11461 [Phytophthora fragariae]|uniref:Integrase catalytic domain-containing protein n=2 Tax=Phytophthora fragariae TaxID=53985 RepID=A0A6G0NXW5_9STRA|nr:hypothetical protein PF004_g11461 [Phytophthora fragariae]